MTNDIAFPYRTTTGYLVAFRRVVVAVTFFANNVRGKRIDLFHVAVVAVLARQSCVSDGTRTVFYPVDDAPGTVHVAHVHVRVDQTATSRHPVKCVCELTRPFVCAWCGLSFKNNATNKRTKRLVKNFGCIRVSRQ